MHAADKPLSNLSKRRQFLAGLTALSAGTLLPGCQTAATMARGQPLRIDVHHHYVPGVYITAMKAHNIRPVQWSIQMSLDEMEKSGIATGMISPPPPGVTFGDPAFRRKLARDINEAGAKMVSDRPARFRLLATLPFASVEDSLAEIAYAFDTLKMDGVHLLTSYGDRWPGDPYFDPVFAELNRRKAVVFIHPTAPNCCGSLNTGAPPSILELPFDEARAVASLVFNGTVTKYPDIKFIFSHAGGPVPVLATRMDQLMRNPKIAERVPDGVPATLKKLYFEVANSTVNPSSMAALLALSAPSQILFGSYYPYVQMEKTVGGLDRLGYGQDLLGAINRESALKLFPRFA